MAVLAVVLLGIGLVGALARPRRIPAWVLPSAAAVVAIGAGVVDGSELHDVLRPLASPLAFVLVAVPLAASLDHVGVFDELAAFAARSRHVVGALWTLAALVVALLNLDAAVVLLTPLYVRTAVLVDVDPVALAFQPVLLASLASGVLVVSNLTNLLAASRLSLHNADFVRHLALPSVAATAVGWLVYRLVFRLRPRDAGRDHVTDRRALVVGLGGIALFLALLLGGEPLGVPAWAAALATEIVLVAVTRAVPWRHLPVGTVVLAAALAVLAAGVEAELPHAFTSLGAGGAAQLRGRGRVGEPAQQPAGAPGGSGSRLAPVTRLAPVAGSQPRADARADRLARRAALAGERAAGRRGDRRPPVQPRRDRRGSARHGRRGAGPATRGLTRPASPDGGPGNGIVPPPSAARQ